MLPDPGAWCSRNITSAIRVPTMQTQNAIAISSVLTPAPGRFPLVRQVLSSQDLGILSFTKVRFVSSVKSRLFADFMVRVTFV